MRLPDVNVLLYAHRADAPEHAAYAAWLKQLVEDPQPFGLSELVLSGFLRIVTNPRIFKPPTPMATALDFCHRLLEWPTAVRVLPTTRHWTVFRNLCQRVQGPLVADAYLAALAIEHGCELITTDGDFGRFPELKWSHPLRSG